MSDTNDIPREPAAEPVAIDASCQRPVLFLLLSALLWLALAAALNLLAAAKVHAPALLADCPILTYGHVRPAAAAAFLYGFAGNAVLGVTLWILCRLRGVELRWPSIVIIGGVLWNTGATAGLYGILAHGPAGFEGMEMPAYAGRVLIPGYALIALSAVATYFARRHTQLYVSSWYLIGALVAFPWIFLSAHWLLLDHPVRGIAQAAVSWWTLTSLREIWLGCAGLAVLFYFIPKVLERPLHSRQLAAFGFWGLLAVGGWTGLHIGAPLPVWMTKLSQFACLLFAFPLFAVWWNFKKTREAVPLVGSEHPVLKYAGVALGAYMVAGLITVLRSHPDINAVLQYTYATAGHHNLFLWGFFAMAMFAAVHEIAPRLAGGAWGCANTLRWTFRLAAAGVVLQAVPAILMAISHGQALGSKVTNDTLLMQKALLPMRASVLGDLLLALVPLLLLGSFIALLARTCCSCCNPMELIKMLREARNDGGVE